MMAHSSISNTDWQIKDGAPLLFHHKMYCATDLSGSSSQTMDLQFKNGALGTAPNVQWYFQYEKQLCLITGKLC